MRTYADCFAISRVPKYHLYDFRTKTYIGLISQYDLRPKVENPNAYS
jgi:hypothetical protein